MWAAAQEQSVAFMGMAEGMVLRALQPCGGPGSLTLSLRSLEEAQTAAFVLAQMSPVAGRWQLAMPQSLTAFRRAASALLATLARPAAQRWRCV